jgi:hypothetical protein
MVCPILQRVCYSRSTPGKELREAMWHTPLHLSSIRLLFIVYISFLWTSSCDPIDFNMYMHIGIHVLLHTYNIIIYRERIHLKFKIIIGPGLILYYH